MRLAHIAQGDTYENAKTKLSLLVTVAQAWGESIIIPNYENEAHLIPPIAVAEWLYDFLNWEGEAGWSTMAWLQNDVDWTPLARDSVLLQIFPTDARWPLPDVEKNMGDCIYHARQMGFTYVGVTYQTYAGATPGWYDVASYQHSTFPGNVIAHGQWDEWYR